MKIDLIASGGGRYRVMRDGAELSAHTAQHTALAAGIAAKQSAPASLIEVVTDFRVRVEIKGATAPTPTPEPDPAPDADQAPSPSSDYAAFRLFSDDANGVTWLHFNKIGNLPWRNPGGDWIDANGSPQGDAPVTTAEVGVSSAGQWIALDMTLFAARWLSDVSDGVFLRSMGGSAIYHSREHEDESLRPYLIVKTDKGEWQCPCAADSSMSESTAYGLGGRTSFKVGNALIRFDLSEVVGEVASATAHLYTAKQYGNHTLVAFYVDAPRPFDVGMQPASGLAAAYLNDAGIESHPAVIKTWGWPVGWQESQGLSAVKQDKPFESVLIDGRHWLKVEMPVDLTCSGGGEGTGLSAQYLLGEIPATISSPIPQVPTYPEHVFFRYSVRLGDDWSSVDDAQMTGGKFPGLVGRFGYPMYQRYWQSTGANGGSPGTGTFRPVSAKHKKDNFCGWSARMQWLGIAQGAHSNAMRNTTGIGSYLYYPEWTTYGTGEVRLWGNAQLVAGREYDIEQEVQMNDVIGPFDEYGNGAPVPNGVFRAWINGVLVEERTDVIWRKHPYIAIESAWYLFKNGGTLSPCKPHTVYAGPAVVATEYIGPRNKGGVNG